MKEQLKQIFTENADCYSTMVMQDAMTSDKFIEVVSELMNEVEMKLKEPNFYIVNSKKYLTDEQRNSVAEKITQMSTTPTWIEIKSEDDLPKESGYYWVINSFDDIFIEDFSPKDIIDRDIWNDHRTHYQPIHKPQPPNKLH